MLGQERLSTGLVPSRLEPRDFAGKRAHADPMTPQGDCPDHEPEDRDAGRQHERKLRGDSTALVAPEALHQRRETGRTAWGLIRSFPAHFAPDSPASPGSRPNE